MMLDTQALDAVIEQIAGKGCVSVSQLLHALEKDDIKEIPAAVREHSAAEREYIYRELKSVMDVYEGRICSL